MSNPITSAQLYQDQGHLTALYSDLVDIHKATQALAKEAAGLKATFSKLNVTKSVDRASIQGIAIATDKLAKTHEALNQARLKSEGIALQNAKIEESVKQAMSKTTLENIRGATATEKLNKARSEAILSALKLQIAQDKLAQSQAKQSAAAERASTAKQTRAQKLQQIVVSQTAGYYEKLSAQLGINTIKFHSLSEAELKNSNVGRDLARTIKSQTDELKRLDAIQGKHFRSVGHYEKGINGLIGSVRQLAAVYFSLSGAQQLIGGIFNQTKALDTLDKSFVQILGSQEKAAQAQSFLSDMSERLGVNLLSTSRSYLKFKVAADSANLSTEQSNQIFESVTKSASSLGSSTAEIEGLFTAFTQILSKGKVKSEELVHQLGDRLPAAVNIMADALGVSTPKLLKMLEAGEVLASDALPKFAKQLEIAYGVDKTNKIDNVSAAQGRFNRSITLIIEKLDSGGVFKSFFDALTSIFTVIGNNLSTIFALGKAALYVAAAWGAWRLSMLASTAIMKFVLADAARDITLKNLQAAATLRLNAAASTLNKTLRANPIGLILTGVILLISSMDLLGREMNGVKSAQTGITDAAKAANSETAKTKVKIDTLIKAYGDETKSLAERKRALDEIENIMPGVLGNLDKNKIGIDELKKATDGYITSLERRLKLERVESSLGDALTELDEIDKKLNDPKFTQSNRGSAIPFFLDKLFGGQNTAIGLKKRKDELLKTVAEFEKEIDTILREQLASSGTSTSTPGGTPLDKDLLDEIQRRREKNALIIDDQERELDALEIFLIEKTALFRKNGIEIIALEEFVSLERDKITNKYNQKFNENLSFEAEKRKTAYQQIADALSKAFFARADQAAKNKKAITDALDFEFYETQRHEKEIFELKKHSTLEAAEFEIEQRIALLEHELKMQEVYGGRLTELQIKQFNELKAALGIQLSGLSSVTGDFNLSDTIGSLLGVDDDQLDAFAETMNFVGGQLQELSDLQQELSDAEIERANQRVEAAQREYDLQNELLKNGYANRASTAAKDLKLAKKQQDDALKQRQKNVQQELILSTLSQASNIAEAISKALTLGPVLGPIAAGLIFTTFAALKIKAFALAAKRTFRGGGFEEIGGGSHESGRDTPIGHSRGKMNYAENKESVGVFNAKATRKYKPVLKSFVNAANNMKLDEMMNQNRKMAMGIPFINNNTVNVNTKVMERELSAIRKQGSGPKMYRNSLGQLVQDYGQTRVTYVNR